MTSKRLAFDMDRVIVDTYSGQKTWLADNYPEFMDQANGRYFREFLPESIFAELWDMLLEGHFFSTLEPMPGAVSTLEKLTKNYELLIVTAGTMFPNSCAPKIEWVKTHLPFFNHENVVLCSNKSLILADYLIDDQYKHLEHFTGKGILFSSSPTQAPVNCPIVKSWRDIDSFDF